MRACAAEALVGFPGEKTKAALLKALREDHAVAPAAASALEDLHVADVVELTYLRAIYAKDRSDEQHAALAMLQRYHDRMISENC